MDKKPLKMKYVYFLHRQRRIMSVQVWACDEAEEKMRCSLSKHKRTLDNLSVRADYIRTFFLLLPFLIVYIYVEMYILCFFHTYNLVLKMLTNAIIKWEGSLDEGRILTLN